MERSCQRNFRNTYLERSPRRWVGLPCLFKERSHRGLVRWSRKPVASKGARGFESLPLRQTSFLPTQPEWLKVFIILGITIYKLVKCIMSKENIKSVILSRKFSILIIIALIVIIAILFGQKQDYKFTLLYQYQAIPNIELINALATTQGGLSGEVKGFVKFDNIVNQTKDLRQYYIIKALDKFNKDSRQYFSLEEIIKMQYLAPKSLGFSELVEVSETDNTITLEDENGNKFFIDKSTKEVVMKDATGNNATLITNNNDYKDFIKAWLGK